MKLKVAIIEKDNRFLDRLTAIFTKNYAEQLEVYPFTDAEVALSTLEFMKIDVLVAEESFRISPTSLPEGCALAYLVNEVGLDFCRGQRAICKFQRAELIYKQIAGIYAEKAEKIPGQKLDAPISKTLIFTSPAGGVGVSTVAAACAQRFASQRKKVLYLNLEAFGLATSYFHGEGSGSISDVFHAIVNKNVNLSALLEQIVRRDPKGVFFIQEAPSCEEIPQLSPEDLSKLLRELRIIADYDYLIIDVDFPVQKAQVEVLCKAGSLILVYSGSDNSREKLSRGYAFLSSVLSSVENSQVMLLANKQDGFSTSVLSDQEIQEIGSIPSLRSDFSHPLLPLMARLDLFDSLL